MNYTKEGIRAHLLENVAVVSFKKINGDDRQMRCTLRHDYLPPMKAAEPGGARQTRPEWDDLLSVWDVDLNAWRSFVVDNVYYMS